MYNKNKINIISILIFDIFQHPALYERAFCKEVLKVVGEFDEVKFIAWIRGNFLVGMVKSNGGKYW